MRAEASESPTGTPFSGHLFMLRPWCLRCGQTSLWEHPEDSPKAGEVFCGRCGSLWSPAAYDERAAVLRRAAGIVATQRGRDGKPLLRGRNPNRMATVLHALADKFEDVTIPTREDH